MNINTIIFASFAMISTASVSAQDAKNNSFSYAQIEYTYDSSGNRIRRAPITLNKPLSKPQSASQIIENELLEVNTVSVSLDANDNIRISWHGSHEGSITDIFIYGIGGMLVYERTLSYHETLIDTSDFADGIYLVVVRMGEEASTWKCVIERKK